MLNMKPAHPSHLAPLSVDGERRVSDPLSIRHKDPLTGQLHGLKTPRKEQFYLEINK